MFPRFLPGYRDVKNEAGDGGCLAIHRLAEDTIHSSSDPRRYQGDLVFLFEFGGFPMLVPNLFEFLKILGEIVDSADRFLQSSIITL